MKVKNFVVLFILSLVVPIQCKYNFWKPTLIDINRKELLHLEDTLWKDVTSSNLNEITSDNKESNLEVSVISKLEAFGDNLQRNFTNDLNRDLAVLEPLQLWKEVEALLISVNSLYDTFRRFQRQQTAPGRIPSPRQAWIDFTDTVLNHATYSIPKILDKIENYVKNGKIFGTVVKHLDSNSVCVSKQSANQLLYNLYNTISLTEMKGYAMIQFSYMLLEMYGRGSFSAESQMARDGFVNRSLETAREMGKAMSTASPYYWRCDPDKHSKGDTYLEITQLLQGYVQNEVDLNPDGTCKENCAYYQYTKSHSCYQNLYCRKQRRCKGRIFNCQYIDSDMWICPANATSGRRYNYIEYENGKILGNKGSCNALKVDSWWRWLFWHCSYCMCLCDEEGIYSDRYISLHHVVSNVTENKVVTGLRFTKKNRILHLQIQQGALLPHGVINASTLEWVALSDMKITDRFVYNRQDYFTLNWENRALDLDDLPGRDGSILTGVRFKIIGSHLNFEIRVTPFNFETGRLTSPMQSSEWLDNINTEYSSDKRTRVNLNKVDVPTKLHIPSQINSNHNQFIEFTHTDFDADAAQTTVPFLDAQKVEPLIPMPLSGAGVYFKSAGNSGGFIGLKLVTYDFSKHLNFTLGTNEEPEPPIN